MLTEAQLKAMRDVKARKTLEQYAPVYLVSEKLDLEKPAILFNVVFQHHLYGWVNRRYTYDGFNDVLYYKGQVKIGEDDVVGIATSRIPYFSTVSENVVDSYGG